MQHLALSPDSQFLVVSSKKSLTVLRTDTLETCYTDIEESFIGSSKVPYFNLINITKSNALLYRGRSFKEIKYAKGLNLVSGKNLFSITHSENYAPTIITLHPSEKYFAVATGGTGFTNGDTDKTWYVHSIDDGKQVTQCTTEFATKYGVSCLKLFGSDKIFAVTAPAYNDQKLLVLYCGTLENPIHTAVPCLSLRGHSMIILQILISSDESILYSASTDCTIRVWDLSRVVSEFQEKYLQPEFDADKATEDFRQAKVDHTTTTVNISR